MSVQALHRRNGASFEPVFAVIVIFDDERSSLSGPLENRHTTLKRHSHPERELVPGRYIYSLRTAASFRPAATDKPCSSTATGMIRAPALAKAILAPKYPGSSIH